MSDTINEHGLTVRLICTMLAITFVSFLAVELIGGKDINQNTPSHKLFETKGMAVKDAGRR